MSNHPQLLIAGASGQLARRATEIVLATCPPDRLILVSRTPEALAEHASRGVDVRFGNYANPDSLHEAFAGAERMLLISATDLVHGEAQHRAAIDAAVAASVGHLIYTSTTPRGPRHSAPRNSPDSMESSRAGRSKLSIWTTQPSSRGSSAMLATTTT